MSTSPPDEELTDIERGARMRGILLEYLPCMAMILRQGTRQIVYCNLAAREAGAEPGKTCYETVACREEPCPFCLAPRAWKTGKPLTLEVEVEGRHYEGRWLAMSDGLYAHYICDITERKRTEASLHLRERELAAAQRLARIGSWTYDVTSGEVSFSAELYRIWNVDPRQFTPTLQACLDCLDPGDQEKIEQAVGRSISTGQPYSIDFRMRRPDGQWIVCHTVGQAECDDGGNVRTVFGTVQDITEQKLAQQEKELLQAQLLQAQKLEAVGQLAGGVAHDFRNQLTVIKGYGEMLLRKDLVKPEGMEKLQEMLKAADRSAALTGQLLAFSRKQTLEVRPADLTALVADVGKAVSRMIGEDIRLTVAPGRGPCVVATDAGQFQQAILNLVANARDAMPRGGSLTIEVASGPLPAEVRLHAGRDPGKSWAAVRVTDTGCGMDEATRQRVFEPFFTTKDFGKGTGLGLAMVYGFVRQSGGLIDLRTAPGRGSTFTLYFPMSAGCDEPAGAECGTGDAPRPAEAAAVNGETVLVVEDEDAVRGLLVDTLREAGYRVLQADRSAAALTVLEQSPVDLLITDVIMPEESGLDLAQKVRTRHPATRILFISGYVGEELDRRGLSPDPASILSKPCSRDELLAKVRQMLSAPAGL